MLLSTIFLYVITLYFHQTAHAQECTDCIAMRFCDRALPILANLEIDETNSLKLIGNALCGLEGSQLKVCCSELPEIYDRIETHPNVGLLPKQCGDIDGNRIIGGTTAKLYEFPWMALISRQTRLGLMFQCGGTIINSRYILTAAHCVVDSPELIAGVRIGELDISTREDCQGDSENYVCESSIQDIGVEVIISHDRFKKSATDQHDIALIRLATPIDLSHKNAQPICLPLSKSLRAMSLNGVYATVAGWGATEQRRGSDKLLKVEVPIRMEGDCLNFNENTRKIICAGVKSRDSCYGDSGGPLMVENRYRGVFRYIQYGIVSYGIDGCGSDKPGVYTDVSKFIEWILDNIEE